MIRLIRSVEAVITSEYDTHDNQKTSIPFIKWKCRIRRNLVVKLTLKFECILPNDI